MILTRYAIDGTPKHYQTTDRPQVMGNWETDLCRFIGSEEDAVNVITWRTNENPFQAYSIAAGT